MHGWFLNIEWKSIMIMMGKIYHGCFNIVSCMGHDSWKSIMIMMGRYRMDVSSLYHAWVRSHDSQSNCHDAWPMDVLEHGSWMIHAYCIIMERDNKHLKVKPLPTRMKVLLSWKDEILTITKCAYCLLTKWIPPWYGFVIPQHEFDMVAGVEKPHS